MQNNPNSNCGVSITLLCWAFRGVKHLSGMCFLPHECAHNHNTDVYEESGGKWCKDTICLILLYKESRDVQLKKQETAECDSLIMFKRRTESYFYLEKFY